MSGSGIICAVFLLAILYSSRNERQKNIRQTNSPDIRQSLKQAVEENDYIKIGYLAGKNVNIDQMLDNGKTALITAAAKGYIESALILLKNSADTEKCDLAGNTALSAAAANGHIELMQLLIAYKADINSGSGNAGTALLAAVRNGQRNAVEFLLKNNAPLWPGRASGRGATVTALQSKHFEIARLLLNNGDDVYAADAAGSSVIMLAVKQEAVELVQYILEKYPIDFSQSNPAGETVLSIAQKSGNERLIKLVKQYVFQAN